MYFADGETSCLAYDNWQMGVNMITVCLIFRVMSIVMYGLSYWTNRTSKVEDQEEERTIQTS